MNTPAHLLIGTTLFASADRKGTYAAALAGAMAPDLSLYVMVAVSIWGLGIPPDTVFREYYYSDAWQSVFAVDNSFILWGVLLGLAVWRGWPRFVAFAAAGLAHLALDFPLHTHDARMHFWPVSDWVFESPVSYWDSAAYADIVGPVGLAIALSCAFVLWRRFQPWGIRLLSVVLLGLEAMSSGVWRLVF
ncbi:MAG: cobalamin biosynthesis protein CobQ [Pseudomonadota bacterium]